MLRTLQSQLNNTEMVKLRTIAWLMIEILAWTKEAWKDYVYWQSQNKKTLKRINKLIVDTQRTPLNGLGKPEPLKENLSGFWSRRIDESNRLIYAVDDKKLTIISCRYHYEK